MSNHTPLAVRLLLLTFFGLMSAIDIYFDVWMWSLFKSFQSHGHRLDTISAAFVGLALALSAALNIGRGFNVLVHLISNTDNKRRAPSLAAAAICFIFAAADTYFLVWIWLLFHKFHLHGFESDATKSAILGVAMAFTVLQEILHGLYQLVGGIL
jgi:hypothetical protein